MSVKSKRTIWALLTGIIILAITSISAYNIKLKNRKTMLNFPPNETYAQLWKKVETAEGKGLTEDAQKLTEEIYKKAQKEKNHPQIVKAIIHRLKYLQFKEEYSIEKSTEELQNEIAKATFPVKPVLQSILADVYWQYYLNNTWKFYNRTQTVAFNNKDISTWDLKKIVYETIVNYKASLQNADSLKRTKVDLYDEILVKGDASTRNWRPTLYDLLAHRAIDFFKNSQADVTKAADQFNVNADAYALPYPEFLKLTINAPSDSLELKYYSLRLFQDLLTFHNEAERNDAILDLELERYDFILSHSQNPAKDSLYLQSIKWLATKMATSQYVSEVLFREAQWYYNKSALYNPLESDKYKEYRKTAVSLCNAIIKNHPQGNGSGKAKNLIASINDPALNIQSEQVNETGLPNRILVNYTNIGKIYFRLVKTNRAEMRKLYNRYYDNKIISKLLEMPVAMNFEQNMPVDNDYNPHKVEVKVPVADNGYYFLLASTSPKFSSDKNIVAYSTYIVSDIGYFERGLKNGDREFYVMSRQSGTSLKNVQCQTWTEEYNYEKQDYVTKKGKLFTTNAEGVIRIPSGDFTSYQSFFIEFINGNDKLWSDNSFYVYPRQEHNYTTVVTHFFTDRAIYRPGQTVYFKGIVLKNQNNKHEIYPNYPTKVSLYDVNGQLVSSVDVTTNEYGTVSGSFTAPQGVLNGQMRISDGHGNHNISVEEYKRPKFEVLFDTLKGSYKLNDEVSVKSFAKAYAGNLLDGATVNYRVVRSVNYPYWYYWYRPYFQSQEVEITNGTGKTNEKGEYDITFKALPDPTADNSNNPTYTYEIYADVTDINGETHSNSTSFRVGTQAITLSVTIPEVINIIQLPKIAFYASNLNGAEEFVNGTSRLYKLNQPKKPFRSRLWPQPDKHLYTREEYYTLFPHDLYDDETNKYKWEKGKVILERAFNTKTDKEVVLNDLKTLSPGVYLLESVCKDKFGTEVKALNYVSIYNPLRTELPEETPQWHYPVKTIGEPGAEGSFILASSYKDVNYIYEVEHEAGQTTERVPSSLQARTIAITESQRGGIVYHTNFMKYNRAYSVSGYISVPYTNKELDIKFETFRNKLLPGQKEEWKVSIKNRKGEKVAAELMAAMYDASLDAFVPNNWFLNLYQSYYARTSWTNGMERTTQSTEFMNFDRHYEPIEYYNYDALNYFGLYFSGYSMYYARGGAYADMAATGAVPSESAVMKAEASPGAPEREEKTKEAAPRKKALSRNGAKDELNDGAYKSGLDESSVTKTETKQSPPLRSNFNETAFFYPSLVTDDKGECSIQFTIPESLTKWKFLSLAHTKDLSVGVMENTCVTQKDLMVQPNMPRFLREGDEIVLTSKIVNLSDKALTGTATLRLVDAISGKDISAECISNGTDRSFSAATKQSALAEWKIAVPDKYQAILYKVSAVAGNFSDGEEAALPVLTNRMLVTESMPLPIRSNQTKEFSFTKFISQNNGSKTLKNHAYTLEFTANPAWYAVQSLPYLMEYPYECAEQTFSRYYANALASHIANSTPKIKSVFETWKTQSPESFLSNLEKNQELKAALLEETPWVMDAANEKESKKRVALLFDLNRMGSELSRALTKLQKMQTSNGGWPWFEGMREDWYITQYIATGMGHLNALNVVKVRENGEIWNMVTKALSFCDNELRSEYDNIKRYDKDYEKNNHLSYMAIQYLYMRSYFKEVPRDTRNEAAFKYFLKQAKTYWLSQSRYMQGMIALGLHRYNEKVTAQDIMKSLKQNALNNEEMGMYWKENYGGYYWYQAPIEMQALMIEAFDEVSNDTKSVDDLKTWLLKSKQTQNWRTTRATSEAVYALLLRGTSWLSTEPNVSIQLGETLIDPKTDKDTKVEAGTGYFKKTWHGSDIKPSMGKIKVVKKDEGVSWGAVYWQYFEQLDKITPHETPLKLNKKLFRQKNTASGPVIEPITEGMRLQPGDKLKVRIELRVDRDMEYVHMKDMRAAGFEPTNVFSGYRWQDGLGYYETTKDASTNFFFNYLGKGTYVFEYPLVVNHAGNFSNGVTTIQCMYAPEFTSHSEGIRVNVAK
ncbi:MAG: alpha-2-macroglobulin family protein [Sediminibacterium sp.]|nr:alpha-2-macroglobulin family protein [Sediminibacterium sp.]